MLLRLLPRGDPVIALRRLRTAIGPVGALTIGLTLLAIGGTLVASSHGALLPKATPPWWVVVLAIALAEASAIHIQARRNSMTICLTELPLVVGLAVVASVDGTNNFRDRYSPAVGAVISRELGRHGALYFEPIWVNNSNPLPTALADHNDTLLLGVGLRARVRPTVYLVGEIVPRVGYTPAANHASFGIEKRAGGHLFQLNFSNGFGTTPSQVARGGTGGLALGDGRVRRH